MKEGGRKQPWTLSEINRMAFAARDGETSEDEARTLLALFCVSVERQLISARTPEAARLLEYVQEAFQAYLNGERIGNREGNRKRDGKPGIIERHVSSIGSALGLVRKLGRPKADEQVRMQMAAGVLERRIAGMSYESAVAEVAQEFHRDESIIAEAWHDHREVADVIVKSKRGPDCPPWTDIEAQRRREALGKSK